MATDPELLVKLDQVIGVKYLTAKEERDWWAGTSTGGPNLDGYYPRTDAAGNTTLRPSPAKIEDLLLLGGGTQYVYPDEFDALAGSGSAHDDAPCLNAMFVKAAQDGRVASLRAGKTYYPRDTVICDPTNTSFDGGGNIIDWRMKTFTPVSTQPNIMTGGSFDSGSGWLYSSQTTIQPTFTGGKVSFNGATGTKFVGSISGTTLTVSSVSSGVLTAGPAFYKDDILSSEVIISPTKIVKQLTGTTGGAGTYQVDTAQTVNSVSMSQNQFLEMGRKIVAKTGDTIRVTAKVARLTSTTVGINTYRTVLIGFRKDTGSANGSLVGGGVSGATKTISNSDSTYVAGVGGTFSWDVVLQSDNPYIRIQSNASFEIDDIDIRVVPNNKCLLFRASPETGVVGVNGKRFGHVMLRGTQSTDDLTIRAVDGMTFDTPQATYSTQAALYDIRCTTGIGRAVVMQNRAYLMRFFACRLIGRECALDTLPGSEDAGENISFVACQMGSGQGGPGTGPAVRNPGGFGLHFFGCSFDFPAQWYKGRGSVEFHGCWLEKNMIVSAAVFSIDVEAGHVQMYGGRIQFDGWDGSSPADTPFRVADGATLSLTGVDVSGARSLTECWVTGIGNFRTSNLRGLSNSPYLISRDDSHNLLGSGGHFQGATITPNIWVNSPGGTSQSANIQPDRRHVLWQTTGTFTAAAVVATKNLSASSTTPGTIAVGDIVTGIGIKPNTVVTAVNNAANTIGGVPPNTVQISENATTTGTFTFTYTRPALGSGGVELSTAMARTGTQSLRLYKLGVGNTRPLTAHLAFPIQGGQNCGFEMYYRAKADPTVTDGSAAAFFINSSYVSLTNANSDAIPVVGDRLPLTDQPQRVDRATGRAIIEDVVQPDGWTRIAFSSNNLGEAPVWATHVIVDISLISAPAGFELFIADVIATRF